MRPNDHGGGSAVTADAGPVTHLAVACIDARPEAGASERVPCEYALQPYRFPGSQPATPVGLGMYATWIVAPLQVP